MTVHCGARTESIKTSGGRVARLELTGCDGFDVDVVVFSAGIRPRDELAVCGMLAGPRGGFMVDATCRTADPAIWAIGECAAVEGATYGLVAPGYAMAEVAAQRLLGGDAAFTTPDLATKLKLLDVDVASFGDAHGASDDALEVRMDDPVAGTYAKLVVAPDGRRLLGGVLVGDATAYSLLAPLVGRRLPQPPGELLAGVRGEGGHACLSVTDLPDEALICTCNSVTKGTICRSLADGCQTVASLKKQTRAWHGLWQLRAVAGQAAPGRVVGRRRAGEQRTMRAFPLHTAGAVRPGPRERPCLVRRAACGIRHGPWLRDLPPGRGLDPRLPHRRVRPWRGTGVATGHQ